MENSWDLLWLKFLESMGFDHGRGNSKIFLFSEFWFFLLILSCLRQGVVFENVKAIFYCPYFEEN